MCSVCQELVMYDWATEGVYGGGGGGGEHVKKSCGPEALYHIHVVGKFGEH